MRDVAQAVFPQIVTSVAPVPVAEYRDQEISLPFVWVRAPSTNIGPYRAYDPFKSGMLYIDIFDYNWADVDAIDAKIAWLDGFTVKSFGDARVIKYQRESALPIYEEDAAHLTITYGIQFVDMRVYE